MYLLKFLFTCFVLWVQKAVWCLALLCRQVKRKDSLSAEDFANWHPHRPITEWSRLEGISRTPCHGQRHFHYCRSPVPSLPSARGVAAAPITQQFQSSLMLMSLVRRDPFGIIYIETVFYILNEKRSDFSEWDLNYNPTTCGSVLFALFIKQGKKTVMQSITEQLPEHCCKPVAIHCRDRDCPWLGQNLPMGHLPGRASPWPQLNLHSEILRYQENFYWWS